MKQFRLGRLALFSMMVILVCRLIALPGIAVAQNATVLNFGPPSHGGPGGPNAVDRGPRPLPAAAGGPLAGLGSDEQAFFWRRGPDFRRSIRFQERSQVKPGAASAHGSISIAAPAAMRFRPSAAPVHEKPESRHGDFAWG
jgi:hypothetical protein